MIFKKFIRIILLFILTLTPFFKLQAEDQSWMNNALVFELNEKWNLEFNNETRCYEITYLNPYLKNWQAGFSYDILPDFYLGFRYKRESMETTSFMLRENRFTFENGWKTSLNKTLDFDYRLRSEIRRYDEDLSKNHWRYRLRLRLRTSVKFGKIEVRPFIATEPFADSKANTINRNRFYLGAAFPLSEKVVFILNYIRQDTKGKATIHILNSGFEIKI